MNILITGGAGFIGSHLAEFHILRGNAVHVIDNLSTGRMEHIAPLMKHPKFSFTHADLFTLEDLYSHIAWASHIYHLAAVVGMYHLLAHPVETLTSNILACERLLRLSYEHHPTARIIIASTSELYGPSKKKKLSEEDILPFKSAAHSKWVYASSKFTEEMFSLAYRQAKGLNITLIRFFNTIGPRQMGHYGMVVPRFIEEAIHNKPITVYGTGEQVRSFCDVRDTVQALDIIANNPKSIGEIINLGQDAPISINALALCIKRLAKSKSPIQHIPYQEAYGQEYEDIMYRRPNLKKFYQYSHYSFQWDLEKTLMDLIHHNRQ